MSDLVDAAWAAGLFEGEGSIFPVRGGASIALALVSTDRDVIERFHAVVGHGNLGRQSAQRGQNKPLHSWRCYSLDDVTAVMALLLPHLGERRRARWHELSEAVARHKQEAWERSFVVCTVCHRTFQNARWSLIKYCSFACRSRAARARKKAAA